MDFDIDEDSFEATEQDSDTRAGSRVHIKTPKTPASLSILTSECSSSGTREECGGESVWRPSEEEVEMLARVYTKKFSNANASLIDP